MEKLKKINGNVSPAAAGHFEGEYAKTGEQEAEGADESKFSAVQAAKDIQEYCRANPGKAMGIAAGVGALLSLILVKALSRKESANDQIIAGLMQKGEEAWNHLKSGIEPALKNIKESIGI